MSERGEKRLPPDARWLADAPDQWTIRPLKAAFQITNGSTPKSDVEEYWGGSVAWITPAELPHDEITSLERSVRTITEKGLASCGTTMVPAGSIIVSTRAPIGSIGIAHIPLCTNQGCKSLVPKAGAHSRYFAYLLTAIRRQLEARGRGTTFLELSTDELGSFRVPAPSVPEQAAIAFFLDRETAKIDALVEEQKRLIELLKEKRQAVISRAVTKGLNPDAPMKPSGVEWLGEVPAHWDMLRLKDVCREIVDCKNRTPENVAGGSYFVVRTSCIRDGAFNASGGYTTDFANFNEWTRKGRPRAGDVLFTREAPAGEACLVPADVDICLGQRMMYLRPEHLRISARYMLATIYGPLVRGTIEGSSRGSTVGHLRVGEIGELPCLLPPIEEQKDICNTIDECLSSCSRLQSECQLAIDLLTERRRNLISAAVTGKIDVRDVVAADAEAA